MNGPTGAGTVLTRRADAGMLCLGPCDMAGLVLGDG
jgi:hypothetical protein